MRKHTNLQQRKHTNLQQSLMLKFLGYPKSSTWIWKDSEFKETRKITNSRLPEGSAVSITVFNALGWIWGFLTRTNNQDIDFTHEENESGCKLTLFGIGGEIVWTNSLPSPYDSEVIPSIALTKILEYTTIAQNFNRIR